MLKTSENQSITKREEFSLGEEYLKVAIFKHLKFLKNFHWSIDL